MATDADSGSFNGFGTLRRSLRQINPFKGRFFRLPATPRLSRSRKAMGRGEEATSWNFERPSVSSANPSRPESSFTATATASSNDTPSSTSGSSRATGDFDHRRDIDNMSLIYGFPPDAVSQPGGSCRLSNRSHRPPLPVFNPPPAREAEFIIHEHMKNLMSSSSSPHPPTAPPPPPPTQSTRQQQFLFLPNTSYAPSGEIYDARWQPDRRIAVGDESFVSPTQSTISLVNTHYRTSMRSASSVGGSMRQADRTSLRPTYQLNGLFHHPSLKSLAPSLVPENNYPATTLPTRPSVSKVVPLFTLNDVIVDGEAETAFLGREWVFKELYQTVIIEHAPFTLIRGVNGSGKTAIMRQLILQSPFFVQKGVNGDTVDSGIVVGSQMSLNSTLSSRNYEWLRVVANRIVAYHNCRLSSAATCTIPEFVRNIAAHMCISPLMSSYADIIKENTDLYTLMTEEQASVAMEPTELFHKLITEPLARVVMAEDECVIVVVDAIDEADFHRNESGESLAWMLSATAAQLPPWFRFILSTSMYPPLNGLDVRTISIDDAELDQRVVRDSRIVVDYRMTISPQLEQRIRGCCASDSVLDVIDDFVNRARGNQLFVHLLLDLIEQNRINLHSSSLSLLPSDLSQLYLLHFNLNFKSLNAFYRAAPIISVCVATLKPPNFAELLTILNAGRQTPLMTEKELTECLTLLTPLIVKLSNGTYVPIHSTFREWVLRVSDTTEYAIDIRHGHILHALTLVRNGNQNPEGLFELGHHLLKANPFKYMQPGMATDLPCGKDCHIEWIQHAAGSAENIRTALLYERNVYYANSKVSKLLLLAGADPNAVFPDGTSLLGAFAKAGNLAMITLLLQFNADVNYANPINGFTPLILAVQKANVNAVRLLRDNGAKLDARDHNGASVLIHAAHTNSVALMSYLLETNWTAERDAKEKRASRVDDLKLAFEAAASRGCVQICEFLLDCTDAITDTSTAMCVACANGQSETVQFLLSRGATLSTTQSWQGKSAIMCSIESGSWDLCVNVLNSAQIDLNNDRTDEEGWTPLMVAARHGHVGLVDLLINRGADMNIRDNKGLTAIMHTIICRHASTAALLIDNGCDLTVKDENGNGLIHLLAQYTNKCLTDRLLESGLSLEDKNNEDLRAVEVAIRHGNHLAVEVFLRRGARLRTLTWRIAVESDPELVLVLVRKLVDDANILFRRKNPRDALHRLEYALEKCTELLNDRMDSENHRPQSNPVITNPADLARLAIIRPQLRHFKVQILVSIANIKRRNNELLDALNYATQGLKVADTDDNRFELHLCRARCFFDGQNVVKALADAKAAANIRPDDHDVQNLLAVLNLPPSIGVN
uniref:ANK_REP_REGION domain-containing protein n=1 Tax=Panagrellus redivivus TaxID=6233 RepID=A0A7E4VTV5_PANRE